MNTFIHAAAAAAILGRFSPLAAEPPNAAIELQNAFAAVSAKAKPAVVSITATREYHGRRRGHPFFFDGHDDFYSHERPWRSQGTGSGVLIDPRGYVLTNEHVVKDADTLEITLSPENGAPRTVPGKVLGRDPALDLAVVKIQEDGAYPYLKLADSRKVRVGDWVLAIGSPFELEQTVTAGIISAMRQNLSLSGRSYQRLIQTDAAINRGNSGGPLINLEGEIVGINTAIFSPSGASSGVGFAVSADEVRSVLDDLMAGRAVKRGFLGVVLAAAPPGVLIRSVMPDSPASRAGLRRGDTVLIYNGEKVDSPQLLARRVGATTPGRSVPMEVTREGKTIRLRVDIAEKPLDAGD